MMAKPHPELPAAVSRFRQHISNSISQALRASATGPRIPHIGQTFNILKDFSKLIDQEENGFPITFPYPQ